MHKNSEGNPIVEMRDITKRFPGVVANQSVDLKINTHQIHALLGENGAGKSTLMNILAGVYQQDEGQIFVRGNEVDIRSPRDAFALGIGMVHQHFMLVESLSVIENIVLATGGSPLSLDLGSAKERVQEIATTYGLEVPLDALVAQLSVGQKQRIEILRLLYRQAHILIFDEPTAVLTPQEADRIGEIIRQLAEQGNAVIYITHKLKEILEISDVVTVMRDGRIVGTIPADEAGEDELVEMMIGKRLQRREPLQKAELREPILRVKNLKARNDLGSMALAGIDLEVSAGEILGLAGVTGNGQRELAEVLTGLRDPVEGEIWVRGKNLTGKNPLIFIESGVSYIPGDRQRVGLALDLPVVDNMILKRYRNPELQRGPFLDRDRSISWMNRLIENFDIRVPDPDMPVHLLSGGNQQRVVLARELSEPHRLLIVEHPTRGLDVQATASIHQVLLNERQAGKGILLISGDLDEIIALCDRILVIYEGRIVGSVPSADADPYELGLMMAGRSRTGNTVEQ